MVDGELFLQGGYGKESILDSVPRKPRSNVIWKGTQLNRKIYPQLPDRSEDAL